LRFDAADGGNSTDGWLTPEQLNGVAGAGASEGRPPAGLDGAAVAGLGAAPLVGAVVEMATDRLELQATATSALRANTANGRAIHIALQRQTGVETFGYLRLTPTAVEMAE
jgi:hypothetical protein